MVYFILQVRPVSHGNESWLTVMTASEGLCLIFYAHFFTGCGRVWLHAKTLEKAQH